MSFTVAACVLALCARVVGHDMARSESVLRVQGRDVTGTLMVDLLAFPGVDANGNSVVSYEELDAAIAGVFAAVKQHYLVGAFQAPPAIVLTRHELVDDHALRMELAYTFDRPVSRLEVTSTFDQLSRRPDHQHRVTAYLSGNRRDAVLDATQPQVTFDDRFWMKTSVQVTAGALLILAARVGWYVTRRRIRN